MKRFLLGTVLGIILSISLVAWATIGGGIRSHNHSGVTSGGGTLILSGPLSSTKACAANFTRVSPNLCLTNTNLSMAAVGGGIGNCGVVTLPDASAKALIIHYSIALRASNGVALRSGFIRYHGDGACGATILESVTAYVREEVAVPIGTDIHAAEGQIIVPVLNGVVSERAINNADASSGYSRKIMGYYD